MVMTDQEAADLAALLDAVVGPAAIPMLAPLATEALATLRAKAPRVGTPTRSNDAMRATLGRWAATAGTQDEVLVLRDKLVAYAARDTDARQALTELGVDMSNAQPFAIDAFTTRARAKLAGTP